MTLLLRNRSYRLLFSASALTNLGDGLAALAFPWLATLLTRDAFLIALVAFAGRLPWFVFAIPAGVVTDRGDRKRLILQADVFRLILVAGVIALAARYGVEPDPDAGMGPIVSLAGLAFLLGCAEVVRDNAAQTVLPSIVEKRELESANGQIWSIEQVMSSFVGPPLAGVLIALAVPAPFLVEAIALAVAIWMVWCISLPRRAQVAPRQHALREAREAWIWMRAHPVILRLAVMLGLMNAAHLLALTVLVLFAQDILGMNAAEYGVLLTAGAVGGVVGGMWGPAVVARVGATRATHIALFLMPLQMLAIATTSSVVVVAIALFIGMFAGVMWNVTTVSYRQRAIPDGLLGRVNSLYRFFGWGMMPLGALAGGWMVELMVPDWGRETALRAPFWGAALGLWVLMLYGWRKLRL